MRKITIIREKKFLASLASASIIIDEKTVGKVKNGTTETFIIDENEHQIYAYSAQTKKRVLKVTANENDVTLKLKVDASGFYLVSEEKSTLDEIELVETIIPGPLPEKSQTASYISGIVISFLLSLLCIFLYLTSETSLIGFLLGIIFSIAVGVTMIIGGFWILIIPLPYIFIWKTGCVKPNQSTKRKVLLGLLTFMFVALIFVSLFALRHIG